MSRKLPWAKTARGLGPVVSLYIKSFELQHTQATGLAF